jgi:SnoaL-like polyketide cyclase
VATYEQILEANRATFAAWNAHDPDAVAAIFAPTWSWGSEDSNADRWEASGTHSGPFLGLDPTGNHIAVEGATFSRFDSSGLVVEDVNFWDVGALLTQLGAAA